MFQIGWAIVVVVICILVLIGITVLRMHSTRSQPVGESLADGLEQFTEVYFDQFAGNDQAAPYAEKLNQLVDLVQLCHRNSLPLPALDGVYLRINALENALHAISQGYVPCTPPNDWFCGIISGKNGIYDPRIVEIFPRRPYVVSAKKKTVRLFNGVLPAAIVERWQQATALFGNNNIRVYSPLYNDFYPVKFKFPGFSRFAYEDLYLVLIGALELEGRLHFFEIARWQNGVTRSLRSIEQQDGYIDAWRFWRVERDETGLCLTSLVKINEKWPKRIAFEAICLPTNDHQQCPHPEGLPVPLFGGQCGIYGVNTLELAFGTSLDGKYIRGGLLGRVALAGEVVACELGYRASHAYPQTLMGGVCAKCGRLLPLRDCLLVDNFKPNQGDYRTSLSIFCSEHAAGRDVADFDWQSLLCTQYGLEEGDDTQNIPDMWDIHVW